MNLLILKSATVLVIIQGTVSTEAQCNSSFIGYTLIGHAYKNFSAESPLDCYTKCKEEEPHCRSFNFHADQDVCELNTRTKESPHANLQVSNFSVYFHSCYRDGYGSKPSLAANSCAEIINQDDSVGDGLYWLTVEDNRTAQYFCNMANNGDMSSSFDLIFPLPRNVSNYVMTDSLSGALSLSEITVSLWLKTTEKALVPISYAVGSQMNSILIYIDETGFLRFLVAEQQIDGDPGVLDDDRWHHVCATWESSSGRAQVFIDGALAITNSGIHTGGTIQGGGKLVLGLDQDSLGGGFDIQQSFVGELTYVYLWNTAIAAEVILQMARVCRELPHPAQLVGWVDFGGNLNGEVTRRNFSRCHYDPPIARQ